MSSYFRIEPLTWWKGIEWWFACGKQLLGVGSPKASHESGARLYCLGNVLFPPLNDFQKSEKGEMMPSVRWVGDVIVVGEIQKLLCGGRQLPSFIRDQDPSHRPWLPSRSHLACHFSRSTHGMKQVLQRSLFNVPRNQLSARFTMSARITSLGTLQRSSAAYLRFQGKIRRMRSYTGELQHINVTHDVMLTRLSSKRLYCILLTQHSYL